MAVSHADGHAACGLQASGASRGVYNQLLDECRCTAGWIGRFCEQRRLRSCNAPPGPGVWRLSTQSNCVGNCDEERGICYCAGLAQLFQRFLPDRCSPSVHAKSRLPDGRPAMPMRTRGGGWAMHSSIPSKGWTRRSSKPFEYVYGELPGNPVMRQRGKWAPLGTMTPYCAANASTPRRSLALSQCDAMCPDNRRGRFCEKPKDSFCLRSCSGHGKCDMGFCCAPSSHAHLRPIPQTSSDSSTHLEQLYTLSWHHPPMCRGAA